MRTHYIAALIVLVSTLGLATPAQASSHSDGDSKFLLLGLGFVGAGLSAGAAGFAVLYACQQGSSCYSDGTQVVGWVLAAPGIVPLVVGAIMIYAVVGSNSHHASIDLPRHLAMTRYSFSATPVPGGGMVGAVFRF